MHNFTTKEKCWSEQAGYKNMDNLLIQGESIVLDYSRSRKQN